MVPTALIIFPVMALLILPNDAAVEKNTVPEDVKVDAPSIVQLRTVLLVASLTKRIVLVPAVLAVLALEIIKEFPPVFKPSITT